MAVGILLPEDHKFIIDNIRKVEIVKDRGDARYHQDHYSTSTRHGTPPPLPPDRSLGRWVVNALHKAQVECFLGQQKTYVPRDKFDEIVTPEVVHQIIPNLKGFEDWNDQACLHSKINEIYYGDQDGRGRCRKLLIALLVAKCGDELDNLMRQGMNDDCFPLSTASEGRLRCGMHHGGHAQVDESLPISAFFVSWSQKLTPPYITWERASRHRHYLLEEGESLPMVKVGSATPDEGGFSEVTQVRIEESGGRFEHHKLGTRNQIYAIKKLKRQKDDDALKHRIEFDMEVLASIYARDRTEQDGESEQIGNFQQNIIPLLATFEIRDCNGNSTFFLLFDCADGNLKQFWDKHEDMVRDKSTIPWIGKQFIQLVGALQSIHNDRDRIRSDRTWSHIYGRHGDIKPSNFLYFERPDGQKCLVFCDLGLGRLHRDISRLQDPATVAMTATYRPPECDVKGQQLSSESDIYSMAAVFLEHITWFLLGPHAVEQFAEARLTQDARYGFTSDIFFTASDDLNTATIKQEVKDWISKLKEQPDCSEYLVRLLEIIETRMLESDPTKRIKAPQLLNKLKKLQKCIERSESFYVQNWKES